MVAYMYSKHKEIKLICNNKRALRFFAANVNSGNAEKIKEQIQKGTVIAFYIN